MAGTEITLLVEHGVVRQRLLVRGELRFTVGQQRCRIVYFAHGMRMADIGGDAVGRLCDLRQLALAGGEKARAQQQVLGWIAGQGQFRKRHELRTRIARPPHQLAHARAVARDRADGEVELGQRETQVCHTDSGNKKAANDRGL